MPQSCENGFEVLRQLHERFRPHAALNALGDLREIMFNASLYSGGEFTKKLLDWEHKIRKFTERYELAIPDLFKFLILLQAAPLELQQDICLSMGHKAK